MREIHLNGYIDDEIWYGDEITPASLHDELYPQDAQPGEDVRIILNSYGGSCNAATQMYDELKAYPGNVHIIVSGTAASAATVLAMAANRLEMTPGSLFMCHDPIMGAYGNEADLEQAMGILRACKNSIINMYCQRTWHSRDDVAAMMRSTTWMDANAALQEGFIDAVMTEPAAGVTNAAFEHRVDPEDAKAKEFARRIGSAEEEAFFVGDGVGKPTGILNDKDGAQVGITTGSATAVTFDDVMDLFYSLRAPYRRSAVFIMNDSTVKALRKLKNGSGDYIWQPSVTAGTPDTILNRPVYTSPFVPLLGSGTKPILFGDMNYYWVADREGRRFQRLNELYAPNGQVGFLSSERVDGKLILPEAVKCLQMKV